GFVASRGAAEAPDRDLVAHHLVGAQTLFVWLRNAAHEYYTPDDSVVANASFMPPPLLPGSWKGHWRSTTTRGAEGLVAQVEIKVTDSAGLPPLAVPPFAKDIALRLDRTAP
ncbi:MAG: hypothetical protein ACR2PQ_00945, partial [Myxococcota bacterium]